MKHLPKHLQPRWRYLAVGIETWADASIGRRELQRELWYAARNLLGDVGSAALDCQIVDFAFEGGDGDAIVRTRRGEEDRARAVLACVDAVEGESVGLRVRGVGGTIRACRETYIGRGTEEFEQRHVVFENAERRAVARDGRVDVHVDGAFAGATTLDT